MGLHTILYLGDYKRDEEPRFAAYGVRTARVPDPRHSTQSWAAAQCQGTAILRAERLTQGDFRLVSEQATTAGIPLATTMRGFELLTDFRLQYVALKSFSPRTEFLKTGTRAADVLEAIEHSGMSMPVFVRTELGSAAKVVGIQGCTIPEHSVAAVERVLGSVAQYLPGAEQLILKEVVDIGLTKDGSHLEYRAIGVGGRLVAFDVPEMNNVLPDPAEIGLAEFATNCFRSLAESGSSGAAFVDVALLSDHATPVVVECKDFHFGSLANIAAIGTALSQMV